MNSFFWNQQNRSAVAFILLVIEAKAMPFSIICVTAATNSPATTRLKSMS